MVMLDAVSWLGASVPKAGPRAWHRLAGEYRPNILPAIVPLVDPNPGSTDSPGQVSHTESNGEVTGSIRLWDPFLGPVCGDNVAIVVVEGGEGHIISEGQSACILDGPINVDDPVTASPTGGPDLEAVIGATAGSAGVVIPAPASYRCGGQRGPGIRMPPRGIEWDCVPGVERLLEIPDISDGSPVIVGPVYKDVEVMEGEADVKFSDQAGVAISVNE